jgi:hypothetical protein
MACGQNVCALEATVVLVLQKEPPSQNRGAQTGVFESDIRSSNLPFIDLYTSSALKTGRKCSNVENRINGCLSGPNPRRYTEPLAMTH